MSRDKPATQHLRVLLPSDGSTDLLEQLFSRCPGFRRSSARIKRGQRTGDLLGYVDFDSVRDAEDAKRATDRRSVNGLPALDVTFAPPLRSAAPAGGAGGRGMPADRGSYRDDRQPYGGGGAGGAPPQSNPYASLSFDPSAAPARYEPGPVGGYGGGRRDEPRFGRDRPRDEWRREEPRDGRREPPPAPRGGREPRRDDRPPLRWQGSKPRLPAALPIPAEGDLKAPSAVLYAANLPADASEREISHIFRGFHGFQHVSMRFKTRDEKLYREDRANRPVTFIHFDTLEDATAALQARQGYVVDPADEGNTRLALNYSSKFNPDKKKAGGDKDGDAAGAAGGDVAPSTSAGDAAVTTNGDATPVANVADDAEGGDATDVQLDSAETSSPAASADKPGAESALVPEVAVADAADGDAQQATNDVLDYDEDEDA